MNATLRRLIPLGKRLVLCAVLAAAGFYIIHAQKAANPDDAPELQEFEGFINYGSPITTTGNDALGNPVTIMLGSKSIHQPIFSTRKVAEPKTPVRPIILSSSKSHGGPVVTITGFFATLEELNKKQKPPMNLAAVLKGVHSKSTVTETSLINTILRIPVEDARQMSGSKSTSNSIFTFQLPPEFMQHSGGSAAAQLLIPPSIYTPMNVSPGALTLPPQPK